MVRIITDSAADFEPQELTRLGVTCIPLTVTFGDREYQENVSLTKDLFYELLLSSEEMPKTAQASPQLLQDLFEAAKESGDEAVYLTLSSALSGTYQTACMIRDLVDCDRCHVVDGKNATGGQRQLVEYAVRLRDAGKTAEEIIEGILSIRDRIVLYACVDTLEYLYRGGRISHTAYAVGSLAQIKPIIRVSQEGTVEVPSKAIGMRKGMDLLCKRLEHDPPDEDFPFYVMYTNDRSVGETLARRFEAAGRPPIAEDHMIPVGAAIGSHVGPRACGFVYVRK